jgi:putative PIN family toxin of toxin-antitoxin system
MTKTVLDTKTLVSALHFGGKPAQVLGLAVKGKIQNVISEAIHTELKNVLVSKFLWEPEEAENAVDWLILFSEVVYPTERLQVIDYEPDNRILESAEEADADFIIPGYRKHLLKLGQYKKIKIVDAAAFIRQFL